MSYRFRAGMLLMIHGNRFRIAERVDEDVFKLVSLENGPDLYLSLQDFEKKFTEGNLEFIVESPLKNEKLLKRKIHANKDQAFNDLGDELKVQTRRRIAYVNAVIASGEFKTTPAFLVPIITTAAASLSDEKPPSPATIYRWLTMYQNDNGSILGLVPDHAGKGNRGQRVSDLAKNLMDEVIDEYYLTEQRPKIIRVYELFCHKFNVLKKENPSKAKLTTPTYRTFVSYVGQIDEFTRMERQFGKLAALRKFKAAGKGVPVTRPLERVEIDHTVLDLHVWNENFKVAIGRPYITSIIDKFSRAILGFYISFRPPSSFSVMECLRVAILPKSQFLDYLERATPEWQMYGLPETLVVDNGKEFHGEALEDSCQQLGIAIQYTPPRQPWFKGSIERYFSTMNKGILHNQSGSTFGSIQSRGDLNPEKFAALTFEQLKKTIYSWIVEIYHQERNRTTGRTPSELWNEGIKTFPPPLPARSASLRYILGYVETRSPSPEGIQIHSLKYNSDDLNAMRLRHPDLKLTVKYDPLLLDRIYVRDPVTFEYIEVFAIERGYVQDLTLWHHEAFMKKQREENGVRDMSVLYEAKARHMQTFAERTKQNKRSLKKTARHQTRERDEAAEQSRRLEQSGTSTPSATSRFDTAAKHVPLKPKSTSVKIKPPEEVFVEVDVDDDPLFQSRK